MTKQKIRKVLLYLAIGLMVPSFVITLFFRSDFPVLGPALAIIGLLFLAGVSYIDFSNKK